MNQTIKLKNLLIVLTTTVLLLVTIEWISKKLNVRNYTQKNNSFKRQYQGLNFSFLNECCSYNEVDPLLGWAMSETQLRNKGWKIENNCIILENYVVDTKDTLVIFITGGSTSDLGLNPNNWTKLFFEKCKKEKISVVIYVAAVGAYGSSQELLKLLRDGININIDLHISYCGANEFQNPYFVSPYEQTFFDESLFRSQSSSILPNTTFYINSILQNSKKKLELKSYPENNASSQWIQNIATMQALAIGNNYTFIGILQPVVGFGKIINTKKEDNILSLLYEYKKFYPSALKHTHTTPYLVDFTSIFDSIGEKAFIDDCHIKDEYQYIVSDAVFSIIKGNENLKKYQ